MAYLCFGVHIRSEAQQQCHKGRVTVYGCVMQRRYVILGMRGAVSTRRLAVDGG